jgi:hypothetical protein
VPSGLKTRRYVDDPPFGNLEKVREELATPKHPLRMGLGVGGVEDPLEPRGDVVEIVEGRQLDRES